jgi:cell division topological specificity factor
LLDFLKSIFRPERSGATAKERLRLVLLSDHLSLAPEMIDALKADLFDVFSRYFEYDSEQAEVTFEHREREVAMLASVPIHRVRERPAPPPLRLVPDAPARDRQSVPTAPHAAPELAQPEIAQPEIESQAHPAGDGTVAIAADAVERVAQPDVLAETGERPVLAQAENAAVDDDGGAVATVDAGPEALLGVPDVMSKPRSTSSGRRKRRRSKSKGVGAAANPGVLQTGYPAGVSTQG